MLGSLLVIGLVVVMVGILPVWGGNRSLGYMPSGVLAVAIVIAVYTVAA
ncbi:DUF3309 family protein [uncultured Albimonas sp.]|tara:strand:- start:1120 stop:1266 length:147 start_codon:yes stop_codon:yes gene_type:complete